jgi:hypothetical protein
MTNEMPNPMSPSPAPAPDNRRRNMIIAVVVSAVLLCCCCFIVVAGYWLWNNGDQLLQQLQGFAPALTTWA